MKTPADKSPEPQRQAAAHQAPQQQNLADTEFQFIDNRTETAGLRQLQEVADNSPRTHGLAQLSAMMNNSPCSGAMRSLQAMVDNSPGRLVQRQPETDEGVLAPGEFAVESPAQLAPQPDPKPNNTGLPDKLKAGVESLSGMSLDNVKVDYNSSKPAQLNAHAYAQGTDIHMGPGQEQHLPQEAWHVVQQAQGRVNPTLQMRGAARDSRPEHTSGRDEHAKLELGGSVESGDLGFVQNKTTVIQRHISWSFANNQFEIDNTRPGWMGTVAQMPTGWLQTKNHIVPFADIQNDLTLKLNAFVGAPLVPANRQAIIDFSNALYPSLPNPDYGNMTGRRANILNDITVGANGNYHAHSRALLSALNSSPDNIRAGGAATNLSIGQNLDADFNAGTQIWHGGNCHTAAGHVFVPPNNFLTLTAASNNIIYAYQQQSGAALSFVLSFLNKQLSSGVGPTAGGGVVLGVPPVAPALPVLVTDPAGVGDPYLYG